MDIRALDLNLLVVFDAMVEQRSVTRAAEALGLSQPAMSAAVARLRVLFDDPLFVKTGAEMRATPRAAQLAPAVRQVIETVKTEILQTRAFDPRTARRAYTVIAPDIAEIKLLPRLFAHLAVEAPMVTLRTLAMPRHAAAESLEAGTADLAVGYFPDLMKAGYFQQKLFENAPVCIVRSGHPTIGAAVTLEAYLQAAHVLVRPEGREHVFDRFLRERGTARNIVLEISHYASLLPIVAGSDLVATVPQDMAEFCAAHGAIRTLPAPIASPPIEVFQFWHRRLHKDPANEWLRGCFHTLFATPHAATSSAVADRLTRTSAAHRSASAATGS